MKETTEENRQPINVIVDLFFLGLGLTHHLCLSHYHWDRLFSWSWSKASWQLPREAIRLFAGNLKSFGHKGNAIECRKTNWKVRSQIWRPTDEQDKSHALDSRYRCLTQSQGRCMRLLDRPYRTSLCLAKFHAKSPSSRYYRSYWSLVWPLLGFLDDGSVHLELVSPHSR